MRLRELSIIQYQNVSENHHIYRLWLPFRAFKQQLDYFLSNSFKVLSIDEAVGFMKKEISVNKNRPIALTFDNGFQDFYDYVYPLLLENNLAATILISPEKVGKKISINGHEAGYLSWDNLRDLVKNNITVGAYEDYSLNINNIPEELLIKSIIDYKKILEDNLGTEISYFGVKEGVPNQKISDLLMAQGYKALLTQCPTNIKPDLYSIGRIQVDDDDFNIFLTKISKTYLFFKDKKSWKYIREYRLDKLVHRLSEAFDRMRGVK